MNHTHSFKNILFKNTCRCLGSCSPKMCMPLVSPSANICKAMVQLQKPEVNIDMNIKFIGSPIINAVNLCVVCICVCVYVCSFMQLYHE